MRRRMPVVALLVSLLLLLLSPVVPAAPAPPTVPLILIHGLAGSPATTWGAAVAWFEARGYVQGSTLFTINLREEKDHENVELGVLADAHYVAEKVKRILANTNAPQADLIGNSRGGLIVRLLATGDSARFVRRAISIDSPHAGVLPMEQLNAMLDYAKVDPSFRALFALPADVVAGSAVLKTIEAREARFADRRAPALAIATTFRPDVAEALRGHDGFVTEQSQLAWPGAATVTHAVGKTQAEMEALIAGGDIFAMIGAVPHAVSTESEAVLASAYDFINREVAPPGRACEPTCDDWALLKGHWSAGTVIPLLPDLLPYDLDAEGNRVFEPNRQITRAEFVYGLAKAIGLEERLGISAFADLRGHWATGYVEAAVAQKLVAGLSADSFGPDRPLNRAQAATLVVRVKKYPATAGAKHFPDLAQHWAAANIEAIAEAGIMRGDQRGFRPDDPLTMAEAAVILSRAFPR